MAYTALYRKYRPGTFEAMIGQEAIVKTLKNQLKTGKISHAYLFCGTRGTGKTSTAKIFARAINCMEEGAEEPCNTCVMCQDAIAGRSLNVIEIDAASNNGVDNIREIREEVKYPPAEGRYKVYIIDEVHMLSAGAFNALLKTLEEPPPHVIFILATTDPQKVPVTILSRCQRFDFKRIPSAQIMQALKTYLENEQANAQEEALAMIARLSDGSMRDALSLLDQCLAYYGGEEITVQKIQDIVGSVDDSIYFQLVNALANASAKEGMGLIEEMVNQGRDVIQFVSGLLEHLRNLLVAASVSDAGDILDVSKDKFEMLSSQASEIPGPLAMYWIREFSNLLSDMKYAKNQRILLEVMVMKLTIPDASASNDALLARLSVLEKKLSQGISISAQPAPPKEIKKQEKKKAPPALVGDRKDAVSAWPAICKEFDPVLRGMLSKVKPGFKEEQDDRLYLICAFETLSEMVEKHMDKIAEKLTSYLGKSFTISTISQEEYDKWFHANFEPQEADEDKEFQSLMGSYFEEVDFQ